MFNYFVNFLVIFVIIITMWILTTLNTRFCSLRTIDLWVHSNN